MFQALWALIRRSGQRLMFIVCCRLFNMHTYVYILLAYDDGRAELLLCVHGLLPISFRGASYNIPVASWIPHEYPRKAPIVYVVPTSDMLVRASKAVDPSGRCNFPYLQDWEQKSEVICYFLK